MFITFINALACTGGAICFWHLGHADHRRGRHFYGSLGTAISAMFASVGVINLVTLIA